MRNALLVWLFLGLLTRLPAVEVQGFHVRSEQASFRVSSFTIDGSGKESGLRVKWRGTATNESGRDWHKVTFCVQAFDSEGTPITPVDGGGCLLRLWMYEWRDGAPAEWKGSQKVAVGAGGKAKATIAKVEFTLEELLSDPENVKVFQNTCDQAWPLTMEALMDEKFRPTVSDRDSYVASFEYTGGRVYGTYGAANDTVKAYTTAKVGFLTTWEGFRIDSATLNLRSAQDVNCRAEIKMSFAAFNKGDGWYEMNSNNQFEKRVLATVEERLSKDYKQDLDHAISQLPSERTENLEARVSEEKASVLISSVPSGAEIEIDEEYAGSTPSELSLAPGRHSIVIKKSGFAPWERKLRLSSGDDLSVHAELELK